MRRLSLLIALLVCCVAAPAAAESSISIASTTVDGLEARQLNCKLEGAGFFAMMQVVGGLAKQKAALDACAPQGAAFEVSWSYAAGKVAGVTVQRASLKGKEACVQAALAKVAADMKGQCTATLLVGEKEAAAKAAGTLSASEPPPAAPPVQK